MADQFLGYVNVESVERVLVSLTDAGASPGGSVSSVTLTFRKPDGTRFSRAATNDTGDDYYCDLEETDFLAADVGTDPRPVVRVGVRAVIDGKVRKYPYKLEIVLTDNP